MTLVNLIVVLILILSFLGGMKEGAVKRSFNLIILLVSIPLAGVFYRLPAMVLSFLPGTNWENFLGFFIIMGIATIAFHLILLLPRKMVQAFWKKGTFFRLLGGFINAVDSAIGMAVFTVVLGTYPIIDWLARAVTGAEVPVWLVTRFIFIISMLPEAFEHAVPLIIALVPA